MNYTLHQLQVFLKIAQNESITKAAAELHLTQPAVSIQLRNLQDQFDVPLTEVIGRKLYVTDFGKEIAMAAEKILNEVHAINYKTMAFGCRYGFSFRFCFIATEKFQLKAKLLRLYFHGLFESNNACSNVVISNLKVRYGT